MKLNDEELLFGAAFSAVTFVVIGWWFLIITPACSLLWALGGAPDMGKAWRRFGCPYVATAAILLKTGHWEFVLSGLAAVGFLCLGYGIPSTQPPDPGSFLGRFWFKVFSLTKAREMWASYATRATIMTGLFLAFWCMTF